MKLTYGLLPGSISLKHFTIAAFTATKLDISDVSIIATINIALNYHSNTNRYLLYT